MLAQKFYPLVKWIYNNGAIQDVNFDGSGWSDTGSRLNLTGASGRCYTAVPIDLTNYSTLHFRGGCGSSDNTGGGASYGVTKVAGGSWAKYAGHSTTNYQTITISDDIDISELEGEYYVMFDMATGRTGYSYNAYATQIWLD